MIDLIILGVGGVAYLTMRSIIKKSTIEVRVAYAGNPDSCKPNTRKIPLPKNNPIYRDGDIEVDVSNLTPLIIDGHSLEPLGIKDGSTIFVEKEDEKEDDIQKKKLANLIGRFVVFNIDNDRTLKEHPLKNIIVSNGLKTRKVIGIVQTKLDEKQIKNQINEIMSSDKEFQHLESDKKEAFITKIAKKYKFASDYYSNDQNLIMSITYKYGKEKDLSFHSPKFLFGIVKYNSI
jgi:hypothetical protein